MSKFVGFGEMISTMQKANYQYTVDIEKVIRNINEHKNGKVYTFQEHLSTLVFAELSNQRAWQPIAQNAPKIKEIFHNFDVEYLKQVSPEVLIEEIKKIHCGNRQIAKQMGTLKDNILTLEKIQAEHGSIDAYYNSLPKYNLVKELSEGKYKLKQMGMALVSEYLKGVGIDIIKPDLHVCRILGRLGYSAHSPATVEEAYNVCEQIAKEYNMMNVEVDGIIWQYGAEGSFKQCGSNPKCDSCLVTDCSYKKTK